MNLTNIVAYSSYLPRSHKIDYDSHSRETLEAIVLKSLHIRDINYRLLPIQIGIVATLALISVWYRPPGAPPPFHILYGAGFLIFWPMAWTVIWWLIMGMPGLRKMLQSRQRWLVLTLVLLIGWSWLSYSWAYTSRTMLPPRPEVTISAALPFTLAALFATVVACTSPSPRVIALSLVVGLIWNSLIVFLQVGQQESIGLGWLGEFNINPARSGVAVVQADGLRWLRPYGLLPHPNILAGFLVIALLAALTWAVSNRRRSRYMGILIVLIGLWSLLLTFSRGAWIGLAVGTILFAFLIWNIEKKLLPLLIMGIGLMFIVVATFAVIYRPFLAARAGIGDESVELRSTSDRAVYNEMALRAIGESPVLGVGLGNFPWVAAYYLVETGFDLRGQQVHNIYLAAWAELGIVGFALTILVIGIGLWAGVKSVTDSRLAGSERIMRAGLLSGVIALLVIGLIDHYPWTLLQFQVAWWGLLAVSGHSPNSEQVSDQ